MKKFFTLCASLLLSFGAFAQDVDLESFVFTDLEGNEVADGSTIVVSKINKEGQMVVPLKVVNKSGEKQAVSMYENIDAMPNGGWQTCAFGNCMQLTSTGYSPKNVMSDDYNADIQTEWMPVVGQYATWEATLQIHIFNITYKTSFGTKVETAGNEIIAYGPKVTVRFAYEPEIHILSPVSTEELGQGGGFGRYATGKLAVFNQMPVSDIDVFDGGKVVKMRVGLSAATEISHIYIYPVYDGYIQEAVVSEEVSGGAAGWNEFELSTPVTLNMEGWESILIGFEYEQTADGYPLSI
ncbi:MAG: hypothetical protein IJV24_05790, partial [Prevotella sp.]|nr:hypothetical protein [Prevotella sp.]